LATIDIKGPSKKQPFGRLRAGKPGRLTAVEIFQAASENARDELRRSNQKLAFSGVAGGLTMGLTGLGVASMRALFRPRGPAHCSLFALSDRFHRGHYRPRPTFHGKHPVPGGPGADERRHVVETLRLWGVVFASNVFGALLFALLAAKSPAATPRHTLSIDKTWPGSSLGSASYFFWSGIIGDG